MLALAPTPIQQHGPSVVHRSSSTAQSSARPRLPLRKPHSSSSVVPIIPAPTLSTPFASSSNSAASSSSNVHQPSLALAASEKCPSDKPAILEAQQLFCPVEPTHSSTFPSAPSSSTSPVDIHAFPPPDLLRILASLLSQIATANDRFSKSTSTSSVDHVSSCSEGHHPPIWSSLTVATQHALTTPTATLTFHARNIPTITLEAYLLRILKYCPTTNEVFLSLLVYFDRMAKLAQDATGKTFVIDSYNVHRLVIAGITAASKFFSDVFYTNSRYAKVGGLPLTELNQLEIQFLLLNDFALKISPEELQRYAEQLMEFSESSNISTSAFVRGPQTQTPLSAPSSIPSSFSITGPSAAMGAVDAYGGRTADEANKTRTPHAGPHPLSSPSPSRGSEHVDYDEASSTTGTETDVETDDEPTIRPSHSCASSETHSLYSATTDESEEAFSEISHAMPQADDPSGLMDYH